MVSEFLSAPALIRPIAKQMCENQKGTQNTWCRLPGKVSTKTEHYCPHTTQKDLIAFIFVDKVKSLGREVSNDIN